MLKTRSFGCRHLRVLINKAGNIVDLVVNDHVEILLGGVCLDIGESELLRHFEGSFVMK